MEILAGLGSGVLFVALLIFVLLVILLPISAFSAQKYAQQCYKELAKSNDHAQAVLNKLDLIRELLESERSSP